YEQKTNLYRYMKECGVINELMDKYDGLYFLDSPLVLSFTEAFRSSVQKEHISALMKLLFKAEVKKCPIIGYIDNSYAKDLVELIANICDIKKIDTITDSFIVNRFLQKFGDRTPCFICARSDEVLNKYKEKFKQGDKYIEKDYSKGIAFSYIKTDLGRATRVEFPTWVLKYSDLKNKMFNVIIAQSIVGNGYPYMIESCHEYCVIHNEDREKFYRLFQKFSEKENLNLKISTKYKRKKLRRR
ncbi:MAG: DNA double-strand break repair nuclease NurA, partial [Candidatus Helarchaeota archaeon]